MTRISFHIPSGLAPGQGQQPEGLCLDGQDGSLGVEDAQLNLDVNEVERELRCDNVGRPESVVPTIREAIDDPHRLAREVLARYNHLDGKTLAHYRGEFYIHDGAAYRPAPEFKAVELVRTVKAALNRGFTAALVDQQSRKTDQESMGELGRSARLRTVPKVSKGLIGDVAQALASMVAIDGEADAPFWTAAGPGDSDPIHIMSAANGLVDLGGDQPILMPHSPRFFSTNVLPFSYNPDAPRPERWLQFLAEQWADDPESIDSLHEVIGYLLTADNRLHKLFLMIGPPRSGKSTIKDIITALIGERNVASCSPSSMGDSFGLEPLLGKTVAIMADARTDGHSSTMLDRLVRITGGDSVEVNRKNRPILSNVRLKTRFVIVSNELPDFRDASKAITSRYLVLRTSKSVPIERRDPNLLASLLAELPGVLNLAIEGRTRLLSRGRFLQASSGTNLIEDADDLASPVGEFVRECFVLDPNGTISRAEAYAVWRDWAERHGHKLGTSATFGKDLRAAFPALESSRPRTGNKQIASYVGLKLRTS